jgi:fructose-1,6-bisphosphatase I
MLVSLASSTSALLAGARAPQSSVGHASAARMTATATAEAKKNELNLDLNEPVFPEVCEYAGVTLSRYVLEMARANPEKPELNELVSVMTAVERACKTISNLVRRSPMSGLTGLEDGGGSINIQGEEQKKLDLVTNTVLKNALKFTGKMGVLASEEEDDPVGMEASELPGAESYKWNKEVILEESGKYVAVFDPLDGSSNVDANIPTGTIFGIFEEPEGCSVLDKDGKVTDNECLTATMQSGNKLVVGGYCLYSAATEFVMSFGGKTCQGFTLDEQVGEFVLTKPNMKIPARGKPIYSVNEANRWAWDPELTEYITAIQKGEGETGQQYTSRYIGSMVGDVHRTLLYGGIFGYPGDKKNVNGKLRLLYEAAPMAFIVEAAGGAAVSGNGERILDIDPTDDPTKRGVHQRVPVFLGSSDDVAEMRSYYK